MIDKTVLELVDRLVAENARRVKAEAMNEMLNTKVKDLIAIRDVLESDRDELKGMLKEAEEQIKSRTDAMNYWADKANKFEKELKEAKDDTGGT